MLHVLQINSDFEIEFAKHFGTIIAKILCMHGMNILIGLSA